MNSLKYIPHIDSLRGVAVLLVILFHFDVTLISGGFIGVDIFFVISGYLISQIINNKLHQKTFSFKQFYIQRIKRLLPAALVTIILTLIISLVVFPINLFEKVVKTSLPAILSFSNFHFFKESGYFDSAAVLKPLLHTWSLSVEEQFYLIWPLIIFLNFKLKKRIYRSLLFITIGIISLYFSQSYLSIDESASFYLTPFRVFEFLIGAAVINVNVSLKNRTIKDIVTLFSITGLILIAIEYDNSTKFPGLNALIPCFLSLFLILFTRKNSLISKLYDNSLFRFLGKISYSLYLVHWPILVFYKYKISQELMFLDIIILISISILMALGLFNLVENRMRYVSFNSNKIIPISIISSILLIATLNVVTNNSNLEFLKNKSYPEYSTREIRFESRHREMNINEAKKLVLDTIPGKRVLIIGDSHAPDALNFLKIAYPEYNYNIITNGGCPPLTREDFHDLKPGDAKMQIDCIDCIENQYYKNVCDNYDYIVISVLFGNYKINHLLNFINKMKETSDAKFIVFGNFVQLKRTLPDIIANGGFDPNKDLRDFGLYEEILQRNAPNNYDFYSKVDLLCSSNNIEECKFILKNNKLLTYDSNHLSYYASEIIARNLILKEIKVFK